eukprot:jgi/Mesvir1/17887/Mv24103-RA.1
MGKKSTASRKRSVQQAWRAAAEPEEIASHLPAGDLGLNGQLMMAVQQGDLSAVKILVACDANVDTTDNNSWTPLHWASYNNHLAIVQHLVASGANMDAQSKRGAKTPLCLAWDMAHLDVSQFLEEAKLRKMKGPQPVTAKEKETAIDRLVTCCCQTPCCAYYPSVARYPPAVGYGYMLLRRPPWCDGPRDRRRGLAVRPWEWAECHQSPACNPESAGHAHI